MTLTASQIELQKHLFDIEKNGNSIVTDVNFWIETGVNSVSEFEHTQAVTEHFSLYSEVYGIKPRWYKYNEMTTEQIMADIADIYAHEKRAQAHKAEMDAMEEKRTAEMQQRNAYQPNLAFAGLREFISK